MTNEWYFSQDYMSKLKTTYYAYFTKEWIIIGIFQRLNISS